MRTLVHVFPSFGVGGAQMRFVRLANRFRADYRHRVVALDGRTECRSHLLPELDVEIVVPERGIRAARRLLAKWRPDLLVTSNWGSMDWVLANLDGLAPHLHMEDGFGPDEAGGRWKARRVWTRRLALRRSTVMLPSKTLLGIARAVWRLPERVLAHIPNGIDCDRFACLAGRPPGEPVIGTVAALRPEKNLRRLLDAFAQVVRERPARLVIVGDGPERAALEAHAAALGIAGRVTFTGACPRPEELLPGFAVFALSSDTEQMPLSVLEAMAAGRPVAATRVGDVAEMVSPENRAFVVPPQGLAGALLTLLGDPARARAVGEANARRAREEFSQERMFRGWRRLFDGAA